MRVGERPVNRSECIEGSRANARGVLGGSEVSESDVADVHTSP